MNYNDYGTSILAEDRSSTLFEVSGKNYGAMFFRVNLCLLISLMIIVNAVDRVLDVTFHLNSLS